MDNIYEDYTARYKLAVDAETLQREISFISDSEFIGDIEVNSLSPKLLSILTLTKNPLVLGGEITTEDILKLLWIIKVKEPNETSKEFFSNLVQNNPIDEILSGINVYFDNAFADQIGGNNHESISYWSNSASIVNMLAKEYGWQCNDILNMTYKKIFQFIRIIVKSNNNKQIFFNKSDKIKSDMLIEMNKGIN